MAIVRKIKTLKRTVPTMVDKLAQFVFGNKIINEYDPNKVYHVDDYIYMINDEGDIFFYQCIEETTGPFDETKWRLVTVISALSTASIISDVEPSVPTMNTWYRPIKYGYGDTLGIVTEMNPDRLTFTESNSEVTITGYRFPVQADKPYFPAGAYKIPKTIEGNIVVAIGDGAFVNATGLTTIIIGDNVKYIGDNAFNITSITSDNKPYLNEVIIEPSVLEIGISSFSGQSQLSEIHIPVSVNRVKDYAFSGCVNITKVIFDSAYTNIASTAFTGCEKLETIYGYVGSTAETFAIENNISFVDITTM